MILVGAKSINSRDISKFIYRHDLFLWVGGTENECGGTPPPLVAMPLFTSNSRLPQLLFG